MKTSLILLILLALCIPCPAVAQIPFGETAGAVQRRETDVREYYELKRKLEKAQEAPSDDGVTDKTKAPPSAADGGKRIVVNRIVTDRSDILADEEVRAIVSPYEGKEVSIRELFEAVEKINGLYRQRGYLTARAILPPQKVEAGVVRIRLVEGRVGAISVEENRFTRDRFFTSRVQLKEGDLVRLDTLEDDLFYFNATNDLKIRAEVKPGASAGTTDLVLKAAEPDNYQVSIFTDNAGGRTVGEERIGLTLQDVSLFGFRDALTLGGVLAHGTESAHVSYNVPVTSSGTRVGVAYDYSRIRITSGAFEPLNVEGDSYTLGLNLNQPLVVKRSLVVNGFGGFYLRKSSTDFDKVTIFQNRVRTMMLGGDLLSFDTLGTWFTRHAVTQGFKDFGGERSFFKYNGDLVRTLNLPEDSLLLLRASGQVSGNNLLPSSEQFQLGGFATVRGFYEGELIGDDGYFVSAEFNVPLFPEDASLFDVRLRPLLKGALFADHGGAFPYKGANQSINHDDFLTSTGFGLIFTINRYLTGRVDLAFPMGAPGTARIHFSVRAATF